LVESLDSNCRRHFEGEEEMVVSDPEEIEDEVETKFQTLMGCVEDFEREYMQPNDNENDEPESNENENEEQETNEDETNEDTAALYEEKEALLDYYQSKISGIDHL
jgi:hypothetical protein